MLGTSIDGKHALRVLKKGGLEGGEEGMHPLSLSLSLCVFCVSVKGRID
jgi:hypothetical protein